MSDEKYIKDLVCRFGNEILKNKNNKFELEICLGSMIETLNIMVTKGQLSEEDEEKIWDELIKIFEEYEEKNMHAIYEHVNTSTISLIRRAKKLSKESKKNKSNLMMSRKGLKK